MMRHVQGPIGRPRTAIARTVAAALLTVAWGTALAAGELQPNRPGDPRPWTPELRTECLAGNGDACRLGGVALERGIGIAADPDAALDLFRRGCDLNDRAACLRFAWLAQGGHGVAADGKAAVRAYERACDMGAGDGCSGAGFLLAYGDRDVIPNRAKAEKLLRRACDDRFHPRACAALGGLVEQRGDRAEALRILKACCGADGGCCSQRDRLAAQMADAGSKRPAPTRRSAR